MLNSAKWSYITCIDFHSCQQRKIFSIKATKFHTREQFSIQYNLEAISTDNAHLIENSFLYTGHIQY